MLNEKVVYDKFLEWFGHISDGSWGAANLPSLVNSMGIPKVEQPLAIIFLDRLIKSAPLRATLKFKENIDVKFSELDGKVAQVRFRRIEKPVIVQKSTKKGRVRDPRLPPVGTVMTAVMYGNQKTYAVTAKELPDGNFTVTVGGAAIGSFKTISEAARRVDLYITGHETMGINGYLYFGLGKKGDKYQAPVEINMDLIVNHPCPCGKGIDNDRDGNCMNCAPKKDVTPRDSKSAEDLFPPKSTPVSSTMGDLPLAWPQPKPLVTEETIRKTFTDAGDLMAHRTRPSVLWGASLIKTGTEWVASARGIVAPGKTPDEAMANWDTLFTTGSLPG